MKISNRDNEQRAANRKAAWIWGSLIVGLLGSQVAVGVVSIVLATSDPSFAVVPDYHEKALKWDEAVAARQASDKLGWSCGLSLSPAADQLGQRTLVASLKDRNGAPLDNLDATVRVFHHARASEAVMMPLRFISDGNYAVELPMQREWSLGN